LTPEPPLLSVGLSVTVWLVLCQPLGALSVVVGATVSAVMLKAPLVVPPAPLVAVTVWLPVPAAPLHV
jgi:hypothetical protein